MIKHQSSAARRQNQYEFDWAGASALSEPSPTPPSTSNRSPLTVQTLAALDPPPDNRDVDHATPPAVKAVTVPWDFRTTFPPPLQEAVEAGMLGHDDCDAEAIRAIHEEHAAECLTLLKDLDALAKALYNGVDPRTQKKPRTEKSRVRLVQYLATAPVSLLGKYDELMSVYEDAFGTEARTAFDTVLQAWHRGIPVEAPAVQSPLSRGASDSSPPAAIAAAEPRDDLDPLGGPRLPVPKPLDDAVNGGAFGHDENGEPVVPTDEEIEAITAHQADRLMDLLDKLRDAEAALARASEERRVALYQAKDRALSAYQSALQLYTEDFGEDAAMRLDAWVRHQVETDHGECEYTPDHPWHYLSHGDNSEPMPVDDIQPGPVDSATAAAKLPKDRAKREKKLRAMRLEQKNRLAADRQRYIQLTEMGAAALSDFDRNIAYAGDEELAWASAVALAYTHIRSGLGRLIWIEQQLVALLGRGDAETPSVPPAS